MSSPEVWRLEREGALTWASCAALTEIPDVGHAFSTRLGPDGDFDVGPADDSSASFGARRRRLLAAAGLHGQPVYPLRQVHGCRVVGEPVGLAPPEADAAARHRDERPRYAVAVRTADCVPILLADQGGRAVAAVHAGWRGTASRIVAVAVERLAVLGVRPPELVAAIGPAIGPCCYEVGDDVATRVASASGVDLDQVVVAPAGRLRLDLARANRLQLEVAGVPAGSIHVAPWCTSCNEELFFSFRRDGPTGRLMACVGWRATAS